MNHHDHTRAFENVKESKLWEFVGLFNKLKFDVDKVKIKRTVAHYISPQVGDVSSSNEDVAEIMKSYGMDVIPVCGDQLAEEEGIEGGLGLILEHQADSEMVEFAELVEEIKTCLHHLGWSYDNWVGEVDQPCTVH